MRQLFNRVFPCLLMTGYLHTNPNILFISLGSHCEIAAKLQDNQLREASFPFDWLLTYNHEPFVRLLEDRFRYFLDERYFFPHETHPWVLENYCYQIEFRHDWPFETNYTDLNRYLFQLEELKKKYTRRVERFLNLNEYKGKVFFLRAPYDFSLGALLCWENEGIERIEKAQAEELYETLRTLFPLLDFTLVIIHYEGPTSRPITEIDRIIEFKIDKSNRSEDYKNLFHSLIDGSLRTNRGLP